MAFRQIVNGAAVDKGATTATDVAVLVESAVSQIVDAAPGALDTLNELAAALGDNPNFATTVTNSIATRAPIENPTFTGTVAGITKSMVGLGNVDNTSDANKPISTAMQTALNAKAAATDVAAINSVINGDTSMTVYNTGEISGDPFFVNAATGGFQNSIRPPSLYSFNSTTSEVVISVLSRGNTEGLINSYSRGTYATLTGSVVSNVQTPSTTFSVVAGQANIENTFITINLNSFLGSNWRSLLATTAIMVGQGSGIMTKPFKLNIIESIQNQLNGKAATSHTHAISDVTGLQTALDARATLAGTETLTNKTIALGSNTVSGTLAQFNTAVTDADLVSLAGTETLTNKTLTSYNVIGQTKEDILVSGTGFAGYTYNVMDDGIQFITANATANGTINFRGNSSTTLNSFMSTNHSVTCVLLITNGATPFLPTAFQIDGTSVTPKWQGGTAPSAGNANSIDAYTFTIIKTASATYTVLASQTRFA